MDTTKPSQEERRWLVLLASSPEQAEYRLLKANLTGERKYFRELFVPYTVIGPKSGRRDYSKESFSLRNALRRYLFIDGDEQQLQELMVGWNRIYDDKLFFLTLDKEAKKHARISNSEKRQIEESCQELQNFPDLPMPTGGFKVGEKMSLVGTPFEKLSNECEVLEVKHKSNDNIVEVRVRVTMFGIPFDNLHITFPDAGNYGEHASVIASSQKKLLDIFCRRVNKKDNIVSHRQDDIILRSIFEDSNLVYKEGAMKRHFLALMLICAHLKKDEEGVRHFTGAVLDELSAISQLRESKAATDTRAYLHVALFIATGEKKYRTLAKSYVSKYNPSSPYLRRFVSTMSKFSANDCVGQKGRKPSKADS